VKKSSLVKVALLGLIACAGSMFLAACGEKVPSDIVDQNMTISRENAQLNARRFVAERYPQATQTIVDSDSTVSANCRFGDGWASGKVFKDGVPIAKIKCQTNGSGKGLYGCLEDGEYKTKSYADEDGRCNPNITELPKFK
jgi:hypothetical protein